MGSAGELCKTLYKTSPSPRAGEPLQANGTSSHGADNSIPLNLSDHAGSRLTSENHQPVWIISSGAYTAVNRAGSKPEIACVANAGALASFAQAFAITGGRPLQIRTSFTFSDSCGVPYRPDQDWHPLGVYRTTKADSEQAVITRKKVDKCCILGASWVHGSMVRNFFLIMPRLMRERKIVRVVDAQESRPTAVPRLAAAFWSFLHHNVQGIQQWSDARVASWHDFAVAIAELSRKSALLEKSVHIWPIKAADFPTPARRPSYSLLDRRLTRIALHFPGQHWRSAPSQAINDVLA